MKEFYLTFSLADWEVKVKIVKPAAACLINKPWCMIPEGKGVDISFLKRRTQRHRKGGLKMGESVTRDYSRSRDQVMNAALQSIRKIGYKISSIDKANGLLQFKTQMSWRSWAGQDMSILILDNEQGTCSVDITGTRNASGVLVV